MVIVYARKLPFGEIEEKEIFKQSDFKPNQFTCN